MPDLFVTNLNPRFTGVSATAANVIRQQVKTHDLRLVGYPLPGCPPPISLGEARQLSRETPTRPFAIWHVRRNPEMRAGLWARDVLRLPVRLVFTSAAQRLHSAYPRWLISRMDAVIATTEKAAEFVPNVKRVVPHGVDTELFAPAADRDVAWRALGYGGTAGIASIGRIRPEKGTDLFVDAMLRLLPEMPDVIALVLGQATREHEGFLMELRARVKQAGLENRLLFPGEVSSFELPEILRALSLVVQLPRYEGYGMVPLEAMASGVPFIGSDAGYFRTFSENETCGVIVRQGTPEEVARIGAQLLRDTTRRAEMARAAREAAVSRFSVTDEAREIEMVYQQLLDGHRR